MEESSSSEHSFDSTATLELDDWSGEFDQLMAEAELERQKNVVLPDPKKPGRKKVATNRSRAYCLTLNNPTMPLSDWVAKLAAYSGTKYAVAQAEIGAEGTRHFQSYVYFKDARTFNALQTWLRPLTPHIEAAGGSPQQNIDYCTKEDTREPGTVPIELGKRPRSGQGKRNDLEALAKQIKDGADMKDIDPKQIIKFSKGIKELMQLVKPKPHPDGVEIRYYYGEPGTGKTSSVYNEFAYEDIFEKPLSGEWYDGYAGQPVVFIDDFHGAASMTRLDFLLKILDQRPVSVPVKGGFVWFKPKIVIIASNLLPSALYKFTGREILYRALVRRINQKFFLFTHEPLPFSVRKLEGVELDSYLELTPNYIEPMIQTDVPAAVSLVE